MKHTMQSWDNTKYHDSFTIVIVFCENIVIVISALSPSSTLYIVLYDNGYVILCSRIAVSFHHVNVEDYMLTIHETVSIS